MGVGGTGGRASRGHRRDSRGAYRSIRLGFDNGRDRCSSAGRLPVRDERRWEGADRLRFGAGYRDDESRARG